MSKASTLAREALMSAGHEEGKPAIPSLLPNIRPAYSTPLPVLPMVVLCIVSEISARISWSLLTFTLQAMMSEFVAANVSTPFLLQMVEGEHTSAKEREPSPVLLNAILG